jgi:phage tail-like protein
MLAQPDPLEGSNFVVDLGAGNDTSITRVDLPVAMVDEIAFRSGNDKTAEPRRQPGLASYSHLVLHRGLTANLDLWNWWEQARNGDPAVDRDVRVRLFDAARQPVLTWLFRNAFPAVYRVSPLDATSSQAVTETIELAFDSMDLEV